MKPWVLIGSAPIPGGTGDLRLLRRDAEFSLRLKDNELMSSRVRGSEEALATLAISALAGLDKPRILIGGFGMGFTVRAALDLLGPEAKVVVAELIPAVVDWGRGPLAPLSGDSLADPRVSVEIGDVARVIGSERGAFDAILLDVDNGPGGVTRDANEALYGLKGLTASFAALRPGGVLAVWSAAPDAVFTSRLSKAGFAVAEHAVRAHGKRGLRHMIWIARRPNRSAG